MPKSKGYTGFNTSGFSGQQGFSPQGKGTSGNSSKYREDYGFSIDDEGYAGLEEQRKEWEKALTDYETASGETIAYNKETYEEQKALFDKETEGARATLSTARDDLGASPTMGSLFDAWYSSENLVNVQVVDGDNVEGTYKVPQTVLDGWHNDPNTSKSFFSGYTGDGSYNIEVDHPGGIGTHGGMSHEAAGLMSNLDSLSSEFAKSEGAKSSLAQSVEDWGTANSTLTAAEEAFNLEWATANTELSKMNADIMGAEAGYTSDITGARSSREAQLESLRANYLDTKERREEGYKTLQDLTYKKGTEE